MITELFKGLTKLEKFLKHILTLVVLALALSHACSGLLAYNLGRAHGRAEPREGDSCGLRRPHGAAPEAP